MVHVADFRGDKVFFTCDECPICVGWEDRLQHARECEYTPQFEYCGCDKMGDPEFYATGYCEDAWEVENSQKVKGKRKTGRAYRRVQARLKRARALSIVKKCGRFRCGWAGGNESGEYVKRHKNSTTKGFYKRFSNKMNRRNAVEPTGQRGAYKKEFDYWWVID